MSSRCKLLRFDAFLTLSVALLLTGCGIAPNDTAVSTSAELAGVLHGGPNPVVGATVSIFATSSNGYGAAVTPLATTTSGSYGQFSFTKSSYTCPTGQYAYVTAVGGNTGAGNNANSVLISALGACSTITQNTSIAVSEATTTAAVYALGNFMSLTGTAVSIGAPAANNAATASCTAANGPLPETCTASGLGHAFANALNIADSVKQGTLPSGAIFSVTPSNASGSIPQAMLNVVANAVFTCVNSIGGVAGDSSNCGKLFSYTTPPASSVASPVTPTNTVGALINLVKYPTLTAANVTNLFNLVPGTPAFVPVLSIAPKDYSLAIVYSGLTVGATTTAFGLPYPPALDYNDNVIGLTYKAPSTVMGSMTSTGVGNYVYTDSTYTYPRFAATDTLGNVFFSNNRPSTGTLSDVIEVSSNGTTSTPITIGGPGYPYGVAVDTFNNVFTSEDGAPSTSPGIYEIPVGTTTASAVTNNGASYVLGYYTYDMAIDSSADLWTVSETSVANGGTVSGTLINNSATNAPSYNSSVVTTENAAQPNGYSVVFDSSGNAWVNNTTTLYKVAVTPKSGTFPAVTPATVATTPTTISGFGISNGVISAASAEFSAIDGGNNIFLPNFTAASSALFQYLSGTGNFVALQPCAAPAGATTCNSGTTAGTYPAIYTPSGAIVDSTGSVWVSDYTPTAYVQIIGTAVPAWPQLSYGHPGKEPQ